MQDQNRKPLGRKSYGHIAHLPGSRMGPGDHKCHEGQKRIATEKARDRHDFIIVQEKLDGSNCGVVRLDGKIHALTRAGYLANTSPYEQHWRFETWVQQNHQRFFAVLKDGERLCGEWLAQAHGTRYELPHEPFVVFDLMRGMERATLAEVSERIAVSDFVQPYILHKGSPFSIDEALRAIEVSGHGAIDAVEGAVWRVERNALTHPGKGSDRTWRVDFLVKYVRPEKVDGTYLPDITGKEIVWNWQNSQ
jgi:hypothetical protein